MSPTVELITDVLAFGTVVMLAGAALLLLALAFKDKSRAVRARLAPFALPLAFIATLAGAALTLVYSDIFGFVPCGLCWFQRIFLYPMPILLGIALWTRDQGVTKYILGLGIPGALVALYQHYLQMGGSSLVACPAVSDAADCAQRIIFEYGFVTFPLMAFALFLLAMLLALVARSER